MTTVARVEGPARLLLVSGRLTGWRRVVLQCREGRVAFSLPSSTSRFSLPDRRHAVEALEQCRLLGIQCYHAPSYRLALDRSPGCLRCSADDTGMVGMVGMAGK